VRQRFAGGVAAGRFAIFQKTTLCGLGASWRLKETG
jgi:hypothetical protein